MRESQKAPPPPPTPHILATCRKRSRYSNRTVTYSYTVEQSFTPTEQSNLLFLIASKCSNVIWLEVLLLTLILVLKLVAMTFFFFLLFSLYCQLKIWYEVDPLTCWPAPPPVWSS